MISYEWWTQPTNKIKSMEQLLGLVSSTNIVFCDRIRNIVKSIAKTN